MHVLILIILEHTLRETRRTGKKSIGQVLILIILEHTLRGVSKGDANSTEAVLILIILEHTLRDPSKRTFFDEFLSLNPYYTGTHSTRDC